MMGAGQSVAYWGSPKKNKTMTALRNAEIRPFLQFKIQENYDPNARGMRMNEHVKYRLTRGNDPSHTIKPISKTTPAVTMMIDMHEYWPLTVCCHVN